MLAFVYLIEFRLQNFLLISGKTPNQEYYLPDRELTQIHFVFPAAAPSLSLGTEELNMQLAPQSFIIAAFDLFTYIRHQRQ
ncbi:hypothetical protein B7486_50945 [cyanobacterium TDX16]|nr:hypothetical protein B7486_50945 [cyanobacterium TDX16]